MVKSKRMMETDKKTGIKRQFMPVTHVSAVLGLREFIQGNFFQADFDRVMGMLQEHYDKASAEIDQKAENIEKYANEKIAEFDGKLSDSNKRMTALEKEIQDTQQIIEENDIPTRQEISANVINIITGKSVKIVFRLDLDGKIAGSEVENPNILSSSSHTTLINPTTGTWYEATQPQYDATSKLDSNLYSNPIKTAGAIRQLRVPWKVLEAIERSLGPNFFANQGISTLSEKVDFIKNRIGVNMLFRAWGYGSGAIGNNLNLTCWVPSTSSWDTPVAITGGAVKQGTKAKGPKMGLDYRGIFYGLLYAPSSDGVTASDVKLDCLQLEFELELSMSEYFQSMIAAYHREMGLSNLVFKKVGEV